MNKTGTMAGLAYWTYGKQQAGQRPILMIHGLGGNHEDLSLIAARLNTQVLIPDLAGFGQSSEIDNHSAIAHVNQLRMFMSALRIDEFDVLGHSFGSLIGLLLAAEVSAVKKLVLLNPVPDQTSATKNMLAVTVGRMPREYQEKFIHTDLYNAAAFSMASHNRFSIKHTHGYIQQQRLRKNTFSFRAWEESIRSVDSIDQYAAAKKVTTQTLIVHGDKDRIVSAKSVTAFSNSFKHAQLVRLPTAGHFTPTESLEEVVFAINNFLKY